jgi:hypothetical protein
MITLLHGDQIDTPVIQNIADVVTEMISKHTPSMSAAATRVDVAAGRCDGIANGTP